MSFRDGSWSHLHFYAYIGTDPSETGPYIKRALSSSLTLYVPARGVELRASPSIRLLLTLHIKTGHNKRRHSTWCQTNPRQNRTLEIDNRQLAVHLPHGTQTPRKGQHCSTESLRTVEDIGVCAPEDHEVDESRQRRLLVVVLEVARWRCGARGSGSAATRWRPHCSTQLRKATSARRTIAPMR